MSELLTSAALISLVSLTALEIVLGVDNIVFLSILVAKLPREQQEKARFLGLSLAIGMRLALLFALTWIMGLTAPLFTIAGWTATGRGLILLAGGLFLIAKATWEIHDKLEVDHAHPDGRPRASFAGVVTQIVIMDAVFSLDSVLTAVGVAPHVAIMVVAMLIAIGVMMVFARRIGEFIERHPTLKILALSFLLLIGVLLVVEGVGRHVNKGYIYFAMAYAFGVELLNMRLRRPKPVTLHHRFEHEPAPASPPAAQAGGGAAGSA